MGRYPETTTPQCLSVPPSPHLLPVMGIEEQVELGDVPKLRAPRWGRGLLVRILRIISSFSFNKHAHVHLLVGHIGAHLDEHTCASITPSQPSSDLVSLFDDSFLQEPTRRGGWCPAGGTPSVTSRPRFGRKAKGQGNFSGKK